MGRIDWWAVPALLLVVGDTVLYLGVLGAQDARPAWWALAVLVLAVLGLAYAVRLAAPRRRAVLAACAPVLGLLGLLAIFSIGLPILLAAVLCVVALARAWSRRSAAA